MTNLHASAGEAVAMKAVMCQLVVQVALLQQRLGGKQPQDFVDDLAADCLKTVSQAGFNSNAPIDPSALRADAQRIVRDLLSGIRFG